MSFSIKTFYQGNSELIQLSDNEAHINIQIASKGALLNSWTWQQNQSLVEFIEGNDFQDNEGHFESNGFRGAKMCPFVCRLQEGKYSHLNETHTIEKFLLGKHAIHGLLYDATFQVIDSKVLEKSALVTLQHQYVGTDPGYPFHFQIEITWTLHINNKIEVKTEIKNRSENSIPMVDGWHPYFQLGKSIDECTLRFSCKGKMEYDADLLPTGNLLKETRFENGLLLKGIMLDDGFELASNANTCFLENEKYILSIQPTSSYPYLQIYTPPHRKSIAIENLSGAPNAFNNKIGLQILKPQETILLETQYQIAMK
jgi:aldose 1-epimerase